MHGEGSKSYPFGRQSRKESFGWRPQHCLYIFNFCCECSLRQVWTMTHSLSFRDNAAETRLRIIFQTDQQMWPDVAVEGVPRWGPRSTAEF